VLPLGATLDAVDARAIGRTIALFERAVGIYASVLNINAYHQPGVEAGKRAAGEALQVLGAATSLLSRQHGTWLTASEIASQIGLEGSA
jgi:glucose-6-phosphate isomerase